MTSRGLLGECPICHKTFSVQRLPAHVDLCLDQQQDKPAEQQQNSLPVVVVKQKRKDSAAPAAVVSEGTSVLVSGSAPVAVGGHVAASSAPPPIMTGTLADLIAECPKCSRAIKALELGAHVRTCVGPVAAAAASSALASSDSRRAAAQLQQPQPIARPVAAAATAVATTTPATNSSTAIHSSSPVVAKKKRQESVDDDGDEPQPYTPIGMSNADDYNPWAAEMRSQSTTSTSSSTPTPHPNSLPDNFDALLLQDGEARKVNPERDLRRLVNAPTVSSGNLMASVVVEERLPCLACNKPFSLKDIMFLESCGHSFCAMCLRKKVLAAVQAKNVSSLKCPLPNGTCTQPICQAELRVILTENEFARYESASVLELVDKDTDGTFVKCVNPKCANVIERIATPMAGDKSLKKEKDGEGRVLSAEAIAHRNLHRFRCRECQAEFCASCRATPYHLGQTCDQMKQTEQQAHCRFCDEVLKRTTKSKHDAFRDVCASKDCEAKKKLSCTKVLACNHPCGGVRDEAMCLPCLRCPMPQDSPQTGDDFCPICYVEALCNAPAIRLDCGHIFHYECIRKKVAAGWPSSRITFTFLECPLCAVHVSHTSLIALTAKHVQLFAQVREKALERLELLKQNNVKELTDPKSDYYQKPSKYAMARFCYYPCFKCKKPYFGGEKACGAPVQAEDFNAKDLVCSSCSTGKNESCKKHGKDYIEYKCRFCCKTACWFCWGTTHFCDEHHKIAPKIAKVPVSELPKCTCGVPHPPNGQEFCMGCSWCRMEKAT